jgi:hypothetical protein
MKRNIKTVILTLLGASALFLVWRAYDGSAFIRDRAETEIFAPQRLDYTRTSVSPVKCVIVRDGVRAGSQYDELTEAVYQAFKPYLAEAVSNADGHLFFVYRGYGPQEDLEGVYFEFGGELPLPLIAAWLSTACPPALMDLEIIGLGLMAPGIEVWPVLPELPELCPGVHPSQLLMEGPARRTITVSKPPDINDYISHYTAFLETLGLFPAVTPSYTRGESRVYVDAESGRSCEISSDGTILFSAPAAAARPIPAAGNIAGDVLTAWETLARLHPVMGDAAFEVHRVAPAEEGTVVEFFITAGGVPLIWEPVVVEIALGAIRHISLKLCRADLTDNIVPPMPLRQAIALIEPGGSLNLSLRYPEGGGAVSWVVGE